MLIDFCSLLYLNSKMDLKYDLYSPNYLNNNIAPVVLLHSLIESRKTWLHTAPNIMKYTGRKVYAIDARNHGQSPWSDEYSIDAMTNDLDEFLLQHKISKVILVGHSIGGKVAIEYAFRKPENIEKLIIEEGTPRSFVEGGGKTATLAFNFIKTVKDAMPANMSKDEAIATLKNIALPFAPDLRMTEEYLLNYDFNLTPLKWEGDTFTMQLNLDAIANAVMNSKLHQNLTGTFEGDVLLLYGSKSQFKIGSDPMFLKYLPRTKKVEFVNGGHFLHQTYPKEFTQEVATFINRGTILHAKY
ncbi:Protein ABHD11 [Araneus ventricosus]|uniref:sn-1-specific diacylglycerol lipase ABHD11 n=1 Tax=Araneus ventricosus TaxID=182803 RepID=A0A4Y2P0Z0_ARAVE|nr:Protein ABHD11 [Araneus ventricosus]